MLRGNFGWNSFKQYLKPPSIQDPNNLWASGGQNCGSPPGTSCLAAGYSSKDSRLHQRELAVQRQRVSIRVPSGSTSAPTSSDGRAIPNPYYVQTRARDAARDQPQVQHPDRPGRHVPLRQRLPARPAALQDLPDRRRDDRPGRRALQCCQLRHRAPALSADRNGTGLRAALQPSTDFNQILEVQSPRIVRLGIQVNF